MTGNDSIIKIEHLSKAFGDKVVLDDINLSIRRGEFITLLGPSGCGKTTLLRMIAGFLKPDSGVILMEGSDISNVPTPSSAQYRFPALCTLSTSECI